MFEIDDKTTSIEKEWTDAKGVNLNQRSEALKQFNNFLYIFKNYSLLTNKNEFVFQKYRIIDYPRDTFLQMAIEHKSKRQYEKIIVIYYDFTSVMSSTQIIHPDYLYCAIGMDKYHPKDNTIYEMLFKELKYKYQVEMAINTEELYLDNAYQKLELT